MFSPAFLDDNPGRVAHINNEPFLFFSGYNYLGIQQHPKFTELVLQGIKKYGWLFPSSRISNTQINLFETCENLLAQITGMPAAIIVANGFMAGRTAIAPFAGNIKNLHPSHPAIQSADENANGTIAATDAVDPLTATITDCNKFINDFSLTIADDSHGMGIIGNNGNGIAAYIDDKAKLVVSFSMSKAFGIQAGAVCCNKEQQNIFRNEALFTAATPPSPALLYAFLHAQQIYKEQLQKLKENISYMRRIAANISGIQCNEALPVFVLPGNFSNGHFFKNNILISSFSYPVSGGKEINRIVLNAWHTKDDMDQLAEVILQVKGN